MRKLFFVPALLLTLFVFVKPSLASEGTFELRSTSSDYNYKCFAASLQMQNLTYKLLISCRNIIFPVDETIYTYILWGNPVDGGKAFRIGSIGLGRGEYVLKPAFASLFITAEQNANTKDPAGNVVMKGSIKPVTFLERDVQSEEETENNNDENGEKKESKSVTPTPESEKTSIRDRLITGVKRAGLASGLALLAILGLVFVLTRPR